MDDVMNSLRNRGFVVTCPLDNLVDGGITFCRKPNQGRIRQLMSIDKRVVVFIDDPTLEHYIESPAIPVLVRHSKVAFVAVHNEIWRDRPIPGNEISPTARIHPDATIGAADANFVKTEQGGICVMAHVGRVVIHDGVVVGPQTVIHRAVFGDTTLCRDVHIGSLCSIGHNTTIGARTVVTGSVAIGGSVRVGERCWFGIGSTTRDNVTICDDVLIGAGAVVIRDIKQPGKYAGVPVQRLGDWDGTW